MEKLEHTIKDGIEQYTYSSALNKRQVHFIDRVDGGPWEISVVNFSESLSLEDARTLAAEINELADFMAKLIVADQQEEI